MAAKKKATRTKKITSKKKVGRPRKERSYKSKKASPTSIKNKSSSASRQLNPAVFYCDVKETPIRDLTPDLDPNRTELIRLMADKWVNGTKLRYYFFDKSSDGETVVLHDGTSQWVSWLGDDIQKDIVRDAFDRWKSLGIGLDFEEVDQREDAEIRIGFMQGDGSWSYVGRGILNQASNKRTMNFGWDLRSQPDTALHEIGHAMGFPHEHQNPNAGILWDEEAVYSELARTNGWSRQKTFHNIIRKIPVDSVQGSSWDPNSVMHYPFAPGLIIEPAEFGQSGIFPAGGISERDETWVKTFYPPLRPPRDPVLRPFESVELMLSQGEQANFIIEPESNRYFNLQTFGESDVVMVLFEDVDGDLRYITADDDSGQDYNAKIRQRLMKDRRYIVRIRLYWADRTGRTAVMLW